MKRVRLLLSLLVASLLTGLVGCDVAVVALLASKGSSKSKNSGPPPPDLNFNVFVADLTGILGSDEVNTLNSNGGNPDSKWKPHFSGTTSRESTMPVGSFDSILIQTTVNQVYEIDSIEILDSTGTTIETAADPKIFCSADLVATLPDAKGIPDGVGAVTGATSTANSFIFLKRGTPITDFRINLWKQGEPRVTGDVESVTTHVRPLDQKVGGADINSAGMVYLGSREGNTFYLTRVNASGAVVPDFPTGDALTQVDSILASVGDVSVAIDRSNDDVFTASTRNAGDIRLQKFLGVSDSATWQIDVVTGAGVDRVEKNGLALNSSKELIVAGGLDGGAVAGVDHYIGKFQNNASFTNRWAVASPSAPPNHSDTKVSHWYAVAVEGTQDIFATGDLDSLIILGTPDATTARILDTNTPAFNGSVTETWISHSQGEGTATPPARGVSLGIDGSHNVYAAGFTTGTGLDSFIIKYSAGNSSPGPHVLSTRAGNDEFLDIAVEPDGTIYATGYETNSGLQDLVLNKFAPNGGPVWKRTIKFKSGADRGVKVLLTATHVIVVGQVTNTGGDLDIHVRKYVK